MPYADLVRAVTTAVVFCAMLAGHFVGDHWVQTSKQAVKKSIAANGKACAIWHCAKHVTTWSAVVLGCVAGAGVWLNLPLRPGWLLAAIMINAVTHFVADLRAPLIWLAHRLCRTAYMTHVQVVRPAGVDTGGGPGTALFWLDQSWHIFWAFVAACVAAGA